MLHLFRVLKKIAWPIKEAYGIHGNMEVTSLQMYRCKACSEVLVTVDICDEPGMYEAVCEVVPCEELYAAQI